MIKYIIILLIIIVIYLKFTNVKTENFTVYSLDNENINYYKKQYIYEKVDIGYPLIPDRKTMKRLADKFGKALVKKTNLLKVRVQEYRDIKKMLTKLVNRTTFRNTDLDFIIIDDITINNIFFKLFKKNDFSKIRFVSAIDQEYIFPIVNKAKKIDKITDVSSIGVLDTFKNKYILNDITNMINLTKNVKVKIFKAKTKEELIDKLNKMEIDLFLYIDRFPNDFIKNIFLNNSNLVIIETGFDNEFVKDVFGYYKRKVFDLNQIPNYLPRKINEQIYTRFKPNILLYQFNISVYTNYKVNPNVVYTMKKYLHEDTDNKTIESDFSFYFLNHNAVNKYLKEEHIITTSKNPNCAYIKNDCTPDMLKVLQTQIF